MTEPLDVEAYLDRYGSALERFDAAESAALWGMPGTMVADGFVGTLDSREVMAEGLAQSYPLYRALGLARVTHTVLDRVDLTERITRVRVRWHFAAADGEHLADGDYEYLIRLDDDGPHTYVAIDIDASERLADLMRRKGVDEASPEA